MSLAGLVTICLGVLVVLTRGVMLIAPATSLGWFKAAVKTQQRTQILAVVALPLPLAMIWPSFSEDSGLASVLLTLGIFLLLVIALGLFAFPGFIMRVANSVTPHRSAESLARWRIVGLFGMLMGVFIIFIGMDFL